MLTNFVTIKKRIGLIEQLEARQQAGDFERLPKKEAAKLHRGAHEAPGDARRHAQDEARPRAPSSSSTPTASGSPSPRRTSSRSRSSATGDTNVDPDELDYIIPANDDAIRAIRLLCSLVADAAHRGRRRSAPSRAVEPEPEVALAGGADVRRVEATDELVAALAGGAALSFAPDEDDDLLPGAAGPAGRAPADEATPEEIAAELAREAAEQAAPQPRPDRGRPPTPPNTPAGTTARRDEQEHDTMATITAEAVKELRERTGAGHDGLQARPRGGRRRPRQGRRPAARARPRRGREEGRPRCPRGPRLQLHPHRRPRRRADRGQLRDGLRRPDRRVPEARPRPRDPGRRPARRSTSTSSAIPADVLEAKKAELAADRDRPEEARGDPRPDRRRPAEEVVLSRSASTSSPSATRSAPSATSSPRQIATIGENIRVRRFTRYALGEEL